MKLYYKPGSCSLFPHIIAQEININLELIKVDTQKGLLPDGTDFASINPKGYVPCLVTNEGLVLTEAMVITAYLAAQNPESNIAPPIGTFEYFKMLEWMNFIGTEVHKNFTPLFVALFGGDVPDQWRDFGLDKLAKSFCIIENQLAKTKYLLSDNFGGADAYLYVVLTWADKLKLDVQLLPNLQRFYADVKERPSILKAHAAEMA